VSGFTRRTFLRGAGAAAAGLPLLGARPPARPRGRKIRKALGLGMVQAEGSLEEKFRLLREIGFEGVELDRPSALDAEEILAAMKATGLRVAGVVDSLHWKKPLSHPDPAVRGEGRAALEAALRDCKRFGGTSVLLVPGIVDAEVAYDQAWRRSQAEIRKVLPLAEELEVPIAVENVWNQFLLSPLEAARYVDSFGSEWIGWHFDIGNVINYGWPEQWIRILGRRILKLHVKDYSRKKRNDEGLWKGFQVKLGEGDADWPAVRQALDEIGYDGWASAEVAGGGRDRLQDVSQRIDRLL